MKDRDAFYELKNGRGFVAALWRLVKRAPPPWDGALVYHAKAYFVGGMSHTRKVVDRALMRALVDQDLPTIAYFGYLFQRVWGHPWMPHSRRWGNGTHKWPRSKDG